MHPATISSLFRELADLGISKVAEPAEVKNPDKQSPYGRQLLQGQDVEKEHTDTINWVKQNPETPLIAATRSIASDHLQEDPKYYTHLKEMEDKYKQAGILDALKRAKTKLLEKAISKAQGRIDEMSRDPNAVKLIERLTKRKTAMSLETLKALKGNIPGLSKPRLNMAFLKSQPPPIPAAALKAPLRARPQFRPGAVTGAGGHEVSPGVFMGNIVKGASR